MSSRVRRRILSSAAAIAAALVVAATVHAHGGETFMTAEPAVIPPGAAVGISADLLTSGPVTLSLAGTDGSRRDVGVVAETSEGHFQVVVEVPTDLPVGVWTLLAETDGKVLGSTVIQVSGTPIEDGGGGQGPRDEDDPLLQPLPSGWHASRSMAPSTVPTGIGAASGTLDPVPFIAGGLAALALLVLVRGTRRPDPTR
jgi:methionine-rich copper-binding protein CopC